MVSKSAEFASSLGLSCTHQLSLRLARSIACFVEDLPSGVQSCRLVAPGLVEFELRAGALQGYGRRSWPFRVGGAGLGDDPAFASQFGTAPRSPIAVYFAVPIAMHGVDDIGFCDGSFWDTMICDESEITLRSIAVQAVKWLTGEHLGSTSIDNTSALAKWKEVEKHESGKIAVVEQYRQLAKHQSLVKIRGEAVLQPEWLASAIRQHLHETAKNADIDWRKLVEEVNPGVFVFDLFTEEFCDIMLAEIDCFEATTLPRRRPNTMNKFGLIINEIGMEPLMTTLVDQLLTPMLKALYPDEIVTCAIDHHHSFVVQYRHESHKDGRGDRGLDMHHDSSEATLNVCLAKDFTGAGLRFCGRLGGAKHRQLQYVHKHKRGQALLHLGRHRHGADDIASGERLNLIVWARSSAFRAAAAFGHAALDGYPKAKESGQPDEMCLSMANDDDYSQQLARLQGTEAVAILATAAAECTSCKAASVTTANSSSVVGKKKRKFIPF